MSIGKVAHSPYIQPMAIPHAHSTLQRPPAKLLKRFRIEHVGNDTVRTYLTKGFSLAICCRGCPRLIEWTPPELLERFGLKPDLRIADLLERLACTGAGGCGSREIAVFPHLYDQPWTWPDN